MTGRADEIERRCHKSSTPANDEPWPPQLTPSTLPSSSDGAPAGTGALVENERRRDAAAMAGGENDGLGAVIAIWAVKARKPANRI